MAKADNRAMVLVCVALALLLGVADVADARAVSDRKLLQSDGGLGGLLGGIELAGVELDFDGTGLVEGLDAATAVSVDVGAATASLAGVTVALKAGKVCKLSAAKVQVQDGAVYVRLRMLGVDKVVALNLAKLKPTARNGKVVAVVVLVLDKAKSLMHLRNLDGEPAGADLRVDLSVTDPV